MSEDSLEREPSVAGIGLQSLEKVRADGNVDGRMPAKRVASGSPIPMMLAEIERVYRFFDDRFFGGTLPTEVALALEPAHVEGYFCGRRWRQGSKMLGHMAVPVTVLAGGVDEVMAVLLHEIVHLRNYQVGLPDCDPVSEYHNCHFRDVARLVGLGCADRHPKRGYGDTALTDKARRAIAALKIEPALFAWSVGGVEKVR